MDVFLSGHGLGAGEWSLIGALATLVLLARRSADGVLTGGFVLMLAPFVINFVLGQAIAHQVTSWLSGLAFALTVTVLRRG